MARNKIFRPLLVIGIAFILLIGVGIFLHVRSVNPPGFQITVPATFDPGATESYIGINNAVQMNFDRSSKSAPQLFDPASKTLTIPLPINFKNNHLRTLRVQKVK